MHISAASLAFKCKVAQAVHGAWPQEAENDRAEKIGPLGGKKGGEGGRECVDKSCLLANLTHGSVATPLLMSGARTISEELLLPPSVALLLDFPSVLVHVGARHRA